MKPLPIIAALGMVLGLALSGCSKSGGGSTGSGTQLKVKWVVGKKYLEHMEMNRSSKVPANGRVLEQTIIMGTDYTVAVPKQSTNGGYDLDLEFEGQKLTATMGGRTMASFDSATDPANDGQNPVAPALRKMIGMHIPYEANANGRIQKVLGMDEVVDRLGGNTPQGAMIKAMLTEEALKQYADLGRGLPDHAVGIGDKWPVKLEIPTGPITMTIDLTYTFTGWEDHNGHKCAKLDYAGTMSSKADAKAAGNFSIQNGKMSGTTWFDADAGMVIENSSTQNMEVKTGPTPAQMVTATVTQKSELKLMDVTDLK